MNEFDDRLRDRMSGAPEPDIDTRAVLHSLQGRMAQARRRRQAAIGASSTLALLLVVGMGLALASRSPRGTVDATGGSSLSGSTLPGTSEATVPPVSSTPATGGTTPPSSPSGATDPSPTSPPTSTTPPTVTTPPTDSSSPTVDAVGWQTESRSFSCGTVAVRVRDGVLELVSATPIGSIVAEVKDSGPETVEVGFQGDGLHCEIHVRLVDAAASFDITQDDPHDLDGDGDESDHPDDEHDDLDES